MRVLVTVHFPIALGQEPLRHETMHLLYASLHAKGRRAMTRSEPCQLSQQYPPTLPTLPTLGFGFLNSISENFLSILKITKKIGGAGLQRVLEV